MTHELIPDVTTLRSRRPGANETVTATLACYRESGDGGGGEFTWVGSSLAVPDDGLVFQPTDVPDGQPGRWHREPADHISVRWFGARGREPGPGEGPWTDTLAIQRAEDAMATLVPAAGAVPRLLFPPGIYLIDTPNPVGPTSWKHYGIRKASNSCWTGEREVAPGAPASSVATLKLIDGVVAKEFDPQMVFADGLVEQVGFTRLRFDLNGDNNLIQPPEHRLPEAVFNVAAIWFEGKDLRLRGMTVEGCVFVNGPGASVIVLMNTAAELPPEGYPLRDVVIDHNWFVDNRQRLTTETTGSLDHSTVNSWAEKTTMTWNQFVQTTKSHEGWSATCAEFHASDGVFEHNTINACGRVVVASNNNMKAWTNLRVANNGAGDLGSNFFVTEVARGFAAGAAGSTAWRRTPMDELLVHDNIAAFNAVVLRDTGYKSGVFFDHWCTVERVKVTSNFFAMKEGALDPLHITAGIQSKHLPTDFAPATEERGSVVHLEVSDLNVFYRVCFGARLDNHIQVDNTGHIDQVLNLEFIGNNCQHLFDPNPNQAHAAGLYLSGHFESIVIECNTFHNARRIESYKDGVWAHALVVATGTPSDSEIKAANLYQHVPP